MYGAAILFPGQPYIESATTLSKVSAFIPDSCMNKNILAKVLYPKILLELATMDKGSRYLYSVLKEV